MATARLRAAWDQTSLIWALLVNAHADPAKQIKPAHPADVHPYRDRADYDGGLDRDEDYHHQRRLGLLPPAERARVAAALAAEGVNHDR